jgi:hypothetical protein
MSGRIGKVTLKPIEPDLTGLHTTDDVMAEYLACYWPVPEAAKAMGIKPLYGNAVVQRIRRELGEQAR